MRRALDLTIAAASIALLAASWSNYAGELRGRVDARQFVKRYDVDLRRPEVARTIDYIPAYDWLAEIVADSAIRDAYEPVNLLEASPRLREAWINAAAHTDSALEDARASLLRSIAIRPGWPFYQSFLGQVTFAIDSRTFSPDLVEKSPTWSRPLLNAARDISTAPEEWRMVASAYLKTWPALAAVHRPTADEVFTHAFSEPYYVSVAFPDAARLLGADRAIHYLPEHPFALRSAFEHFAKNDDVDHAWAIYQRWERAEAKKRTADLVALERSARTNDADTVVADVNRWIAEHSVWQFDTPAAREQAARVFELWPGRKRGDWASDPLADVARYLITRDREASRFASMVAQRLPLFAAVPAPTVAEVRLAAGDVAGADRVALGADDLTSPAWSQYLRTLAKLDPDAFARLGEVVRQLQAMKVPPTEPDAATKCGESVVFPVAGSGTAMPVTLHLSVTKRTLIEVGKNGARTETVLLDSPRDVRLLLEGRQDQLISARATCGDRNACGSISKP